MEIIENMIKTSVITNKDEIDIIVKMDINTNFVVVKSIDNKFIENEIFKMNEGQLFLQDDFMNKTCISSQEFKVISLNSKIPNLKYIYMFNSPSTAQSKSSINNFFKDINNKITKIHFEAILHIMEQIKIRLLEKFIDSY